jgi:hypothetical protein
MDALTPPPSGWLSALSTNTMVRDEETTAEDTVEEETEEQETE